MKRSVISVVLCIVATVVIIVVTLALLVPFLRGWSLRHSLLALANGASAIRVIEHSDRFDLPVDLERKYEEKNFRSAVLSADQASNLRRAFPVSLDYSLSVSTACIFSSHHRVEFVHQDRRVTSLEICFQCGEIRLDGGGTRIMPVGWDSSLRSFIVSLGMSPIPKELAVHNER